MKKIVATVLIGAFLFITCSNPGSSQHSETAREYPIIFNGIERDSIPYFHDFAHGQLQNGFSCSRIRSVLRLSSTVLNIA
jgi:hypothetical protein